MSLPEAPLTPARCPVCDDWGLNPVEGDGGLIVGYVECECGADPALRNAQEIADSVRWLYDQACEDRRFSQSEAAHLREPVIRGLEVVSHL